MSGIAGITLCVRSIDPGTGTTIPIALSARGYRAGASSGIGLKSGCRPINRASMSTKERLGGGSIALSSGCLILSSSSALFRVAA